YGKPLMLSLLFFEAQRAGSLPKDQRIPWRKPAHVNDGKDLQADLSGGYYDAGDFVKFGLPGSFTLSMLGWTALDYQKGIETSGQTQYLHQAIRWGTDYLLKCQLGPDRFVIQVGDPKPDHDYWGSPEDMPSSTPRPVYLATKQWPASEPLAESAAALAAASIVLGPEDAAYGSKLLQTAKDLFSQAERYPGLYQNGLRKQIRGEMQGVNDCYESSGYQDELAWAAAWLHRATKEPSYLTKAKQYFDAFSEAEIRHSFLNWDDKAIGALALLAKAEGGSSKYAVMLKEHADWISTKAPRTPGGLLWLPASDWGSSSVALSSSFILGFAYDHLPSPNAAWDVFSRSQVDYLLGKNPAKRNYVVGADASSPLRVHHAAAQGVLPPGKGWEIYESASPNRYVLWGAIVGGPGKKDDFRDARGDFKGNEPAMDYNAVMVAALGRMTT
ncbi:Six-hairpin glycosidase-like protein, partial [Piptocephalis cylindrospora]